MFCLLQRCLLPFLEFLFSQHKFQLMFSANTAKRYQKDNSRPGHINFQFRLQSLFHGFPGGTCDQTKMNAFLILLESEVIQYIAGRCSHGKRNISSIHVILLIKLHKFLHLFSIADRNHHIDLTHLSAPLSCFSIIL